MRTREEVDIRIQHVSHRYSSQYAVDDVSFELTGHHIVGLLGANGAGKSTLMNIICGSLTPTAGDVEINGHSILHDSVEAKNRLGFLPQKPPLLPDLTVEEYLRFAARLRTDSVPRGAVEEAMEKCGITHFRRRLIKHLSGGYQQRVGIAQAIIHKPAFIVLDEPTNGLDPMQIIEIRKLIGEISKDCLVLLSTHILQEVQLTCEHILMMNNGKLIFNGDIHAFNSSIAPKSVIVSFREGIDENRLKAVAGIRSIEPVFDEPNAFRIDFVGNVDDLCEDIIRLSVESGLHLLEVKKEQPLADDIFKFLTLKNK